MLGQLDGEWVNKPDTYGIHTTIMPAPGTTSEQMFGAFHFKTDEYAKTTPNPHPNPNHHACITLALTSTPLPNLCRIFPL